MCIDGGGSGSFRHFRGFGNNLTLFIRNHGGGRVKAHTFGSLHLMIGRDRSIHLFSLEKRREAATGVMNNVVLLVFLWSSLNYLKLENI